MAWITRTQNRHDRLRDVVASSVSADQNTTLYCISSVRGFSLIHTFDLPRMRVLLPHLPLVVEDGCCFFHDLFHGGLDLLLSGAEAQHAESRARKRPSSVQPVIITWPRALTRSSSR